MVLDKLENAERYILLHPLFQKAFIFLERYGKTIPEEGQVQLHEEFCIAVYAEGAGKPQSEVPLESHKTYIDIHYIIEGTEVFGWRPVHRCRKVTEEYNEERDIQFFGDAPETWITLTPGSFVIVFPEDAHAPMAGSGTIRKFVIKVHV